jgi:hypothetical protein
MDTGLVPGQTSAAGISSSAASDLGICLILPLPVLAVISRIGRDLIVQFVRTVRQAVFLQR